MPRRISALLPILAVASLSLTGAAASASAASAQHPDTGADVQPERVRTLSELTLRGALGYPN
jgi:hypothetical protein